jgi:hypothetical protein
MTAKYVVNDEKAELVRHAIELYCRNASAVQTWFEDIMLLAYWTEEAIQDGLILDPKERAAKQAKAKQEAVA